MENIYISAHLLSRIVLNKVFIRNYFNQNAHVHKIKRKRQIISEAWAHNLDRMIDSWLGKF